MVEAPRKCDRRLGSYVDANPHHGFGREDDEVGQPQLLCGGRNSAQRLHLPAQCLPGGGAHYHHRALVLAQRRHLAWARAHCSR